MYLQPVTLDILHLPSSSAVAVTMNNSIYSEGSYPKRPAIDPTSSIHPSSSHPERHLLLNQRSVTDDDLRYGLQYHTNFDVAQGAECTEDWMSSSINGQELEAPGSSNLSLSYSIAFPSSVSAARTSSDLISDPAVVYNTMTTNESESMSSDGSTTQGSLSFWIVDNKTTTRAKHYQCECGKITKNKGDMRRHRQSLKHSGRSHSCLCGGSYTRKDSFKRHAQVCSYAAGDLNHA